MVNLIVGSEQVVHNLDDWIVEPKSLRISVITQFIRNIDLLSLLKLQDEHGFLELDLS